MIIKVSANGKVLLHPDLAGSVFNVQELPGGGFFLKWKGRRQGQSGRLVQDAATRALLHKLGQQQKAASLSDLPA
jgi:hypothetical protein